MRTVLIPVGGAFHVHHHVTTNDVTLITKPVVRYKSGTVGVKCLQCQKKWLWKSKGLEYPFILKKCS